MAIAAHLVGTNGSVGATGLVAVALPDLSAVLRPPAWQADAACREHPELSWFPERGEDVRPAKRVCDECLVESECRAWAIGQGAGLVGIWGGLSDQARRRLLRAHPVPSDAVRRRAPRLRATPTERSASATPDRRACSCSCGRRFGLRSLWDNHVEAWRQVNSSAVHELVAG